MRWRARKRFCDAVCSALSAALRMAGKIRQNAQETEMQMNFDVAIVGSGLAGLSVALNLAQTRRVALIAKRSMMEGASDYAQGGIAAVLDSADSVENHVNDTLIAGGGLCDEAATRYIVEHGREAIEWLISQGVPFTKDDAAELGFHLTREGGHSHRRIIHAADATGHAVLATLSERARAHPNITFFEDHHAIDLITSDRLGLPGLPGRHCVGLYALDVQTGRTMTIEAPHTVLATGGAGKVYLYTTNPDTATGDGIAMAWRAGARVANMEFIQFHPTCLFHPYAKSFLISEAVRGEGGLLKLPDGTRFMPAHDPRAELAPRDIVARAIDFEIKKRGIDCVYLDISHQPEAFLREHFPTIYARCAEFGIDISKQPIPVVPAAHYTCGGVVTDLAGRTDITGLYAVGETSYTGLHGANRLASNSLLECLVIGRAAAEAIEAAGYDSATHGPLPAWDESRVADADEEVVVAHNWDELRRLMWNYVGIVRTDKRLERAQHRLKLLRDEIHEYYANFRVSRDLLELRNLVDVASLIVDSARARHESRGLHYSRDWPHALPKALPTVLTPPRRASK
ncbi:L-aspartate oxidase [Burkholderia pseudomallei]|nr:L-aspartate oxidase [Burkholderia pseudomallei]OMR96483.1 L-aspartate oxidase [Burkholderia pseudomallei]OMR99825.1 L-aspartate oxidase [Burkholderia pseudomallei]OMS15437.1 L-aspartate oxidase [Burkholderia pseudomallei]OMS31589.1 L-aspartate oxidase [Burkholderia pseudomallei]OMT07980.1 L-aspartate oxidase [Burkholderia pseudomallei]